MLSSAVSYRCIAMLDLRGIGLGGGADADLRRVADADGAYRYARFAPFRICCYR